MSQVRPTTAVIHLDALQQNLRAVREIIPAETGILAAIKGDAYGHGAQECAKALERVGVDWFGVALVEEGRALRQSGIKKPILCLGGVGPAGADAAIDSNLTPVVSGLTDAEAIEKAAKSRHEPWGIHLKVDTGMGRLGVPISEWERFLDRLAEFRWLRVDGICSHLSDSEENDGPGAVWTAEQGRRFLTAVQAARARGFHPPLLHLANSGAILHHPQFHWDLVRPGLLLYGHTPFGPNHESTKRVPASLRPVMEVKTQVLLVRDLPAGVGVSYGRKWTTSRPTKIATLPVGYADGYPRALSGNAEVLIHGHRAPVCGTICMDICMIDVTDVPHAIAPGDEVVLMGRQGEDEITAWEVAKWADTIPYEILTGFSTRIPRLSTDGS